MKPTPTVSLDESILGREVAVRGKKGRDGRKQALLNLLREQGNGSGAVTKNLAQSSLLRVNRRSLATQEKLSKIDSKKYSRPLFTELRARIKTANDQDLGPTIAQFCQEKQVSDQEQKKLITALAKSYAQEGRVEAMGRDTLEQRATNTQVARALLQGIEESNLKPEEKYIALRRFAAATDRRYLTTGVWAELAQDQSVQKKIKQEQETVIQRIQSLREKVDAVSGKATTFAHMRSARQGNAVNVLRDLAQLEREAGILISYESHLKKDRSANPNTPVTEAFDEARKELTAIRDNKEQGPKLLSIWRNHVENPTTKLSDLRVDFSVLDGQGEMWNTLGNRRLVNKALGSWSAGIEPYLRKKERLEKWREENAELKAKITEREELLKMLKNNPKLMESIRNAFFNHPGKMLAGGVVTAGTIIATGMVAAPLLVAAGIPTSYAAIRAAGRRGRRIWHYAGMQRDALRGRIANNWFIQQAKKMTQISAEAAAAKWRDLPKVLEEYARMFGKVQGNTDCAAQKILVDHLLAKFNAQPAAT